MAENIGAKIELEGEAQFRKALSEINTNLRTLGTEMVKVKSEFDKNDRSIESYTRKNEVLTKQIEEQKNKVKTLEEGLKAAAKEYGENSTQAQKWQQDLNRATANLNKMQRELETNTEAMRKLSDEGLKFAEKMKQASESLKDFGEKAIQAGKTLSATVTTPIMAAGGAAFKMAADLEDAMGATEQIFKGAANEVKNWADNLESYYGIAESQALEYANMMGSLLQNIGGLTEEEAAKQAQTLIELAGDLTAMYGGTTQDAVRALTGALKGNNTMLDNYGMAVNDALVKSKAFEMGLYNGTGQMELAAKQAATLALIMEQSAAAQGQAAREADGASGSMRSLATELKNIATDLGEILLPIATPFIQKLRDIVAQFKDLKSETQEMIVKIAGLAAAIGPALLVIGKLSTGIGSIVGVIGMAKEALGAGKGLAGVLTAIAGPAGPVMLAVAAVGALAAAGIALYKNWDTVVYHVKNAIATLEYKFSTTFSNIKIIIFEKINDAIAKLQELLGWIPIIGDKLDELSGEVNNVIDEAEQAKQTALIEYENAKRINSYNKALSEIGKITKEHTDEMLNDLKREKFERNAVSKVVSETADKAVVSMEKVKSSSKSLTDTISEGLQKVTSMFNYTTDFLYKKLELWRLQNDLTTDSTEYLTEHLKVQKQELELLTQKIAATEEALAEIVQKYGEGSEEALKYKNQLLDLRIEQEKLKDSIEGTTKAINDMVDAQTRARIEAYDKLSDSEKSALRSKTQQEQANFYKTYKAEIDAISRRQGVDLSVAQEMLKENLRSGIPKYARGTNNHPGGWAIINEEGPEAVYLPRGTQVIPHEETKNLLRPVTINLNIGTLVADDYGLKQLERKLKEIRIGENLRLGVTG